MDNWKWTGLLETFGCHLGKPYRSYTVSTRTELDQLLKNAEFGAAEQIQLVEVVMPALDAPDALTQTANNKA